MKASVSDPEIDPCDLTRCRERYIPAMRRNVQVPRHIVRLAGDRNRGWQVRFDKPSRYFADSVYGDPTASLEAAKAYLRRIWRPIPWNSRRKLEGGVRIIRDARGQWYAEAYGPKEGMISRVYIGLDHTYTKSKEKVALKKARTIRQGFLESVPVPIR